MHFWKNEHICMNIDLREKKSKLELEEKALVNEYHLTFR